jgi:hypothetical protein
MKVSDITISVGNIGSDKTIELCGLNIYVEDGKIDQEQDYIIDNEKHLNALFHYVDKYESKNSGQMKERIIEFLNSYEGDVSCYVILDKELKNDVDIIDAIMGNIFASSGREYREILEYNNISPCGGEDITYFPDSIAHCFMDNIEKVANKIGLYQYLSKKELHEFAYKLMINKNETHYIRDKMQAYEHQEELVLLENEILDIIEKYGDLLYVTDMDAMDDFYIHERQKEIIERKILDIKLLIKAGSEIKFTWFERKFINKDVYRNNQQMLIYLVHKKEELQKELLELSVKYEPLISDTRRYDMLGEDVHKKCRKYFNENSIPTNKQEVLEYFETLKTKIEEERERYEYFKKTLTTANY